VRTLLAAVSLLAAGAPLAAQMPPRTLMVQNWTRARASALGYLDAMPDSAMRFRPARGARDFAQQLHHLAYVNALAAAQLSPARSFTTPADTGTLLRDRRALRAYVARSYDDLITQLRAAPDSVFSGGAVLFGERRPRWQWLEVAREHAVWTLGQTVPYLRLNGVVPPAYLAF
jgi:hypothetical protein